MLKFLIAQLPSSQPWSPLKLPEIQNIYVLIFIRNTIYLKWIIVLLEVGLYSLGMHVNIICIRSGYLLYDDDEQLDSNPLFALYRCRQTSVFV